MENHRSDHNAIPKKGSLKKQLSFDEKVTEFRLLSRENNKNMCSTKSYKRGIRWWAPSDKNIFGCFCNDTSIHGLQYLGAEGIHIGERILWGIVFLASAVTSLWLIKAVFVKYYDSPVVVTFQSSEMFIGDLPYPAVTICNMNRINIRKRTTISCRASIDVENKIWLPGKLDNNDAHCLIMIANLSDDTSDKVKKARKNVYYLDHVCSVSNKPFSKMFDYSTKRGTVDPALLAKVNLTTDDEDVDDVLRFLRNASQPCRKMIQLCMWEGNRTICQKVFRTIETNFGTCCVFNMVPHTLLHTYTNDTRDSEDLLKKWKENDGNFDNLFTESTAKRPRHQNRAGKSSGLMFLADPALDEYFCTGSDSTGFRLTVHFSYDIPHVTDFGIAIRPNYEHFVSITPNVIRADDVIRSYSIEKRQCYFDNEFSLKYYNYYSASNCLDECVANITYEKCSCVRYYMPRDDTRDICSPANISCAEDVKKSIFRSGVKIMCQLCLPTCNEVRYSASSTMAPLQRYDLWVDEHNKSAPWAKKNISIVHVYFGEDSTYPKVRGQLYGVTDLIANTGGLLGLCMGFSLLSLVEIIYYFTVRPWYKKEHHRTNQSLDVCAPESNNSSCEHNGNGNKYFARVASQTEARRVTMKPGDDGKYHLQVCRTNSNGNSNGSKKHEGTGTNGVISESVNGEKSDDDSKL